MLDVFAQESNLRAYASSLFGTVRDCMKLQEFEEAAKWRAKYDAAAAEVKSFRALVNEHCKTLKIDDCRASNGAEPGASG